MHPGQTDGLLRYMDRLLQAAQQLQHSLSSGNAAVPYLLISRLTTEGLQLLPLVRLLVSGLCFSTTAGCCAAVCLLELSILLLLSTQQVAAAGCWPAA